MCVVVQVQEIQTQSARQHMEQGYQKEEVKRLRTQLTDLRGKLGDLESRVGCPRPSGLHR